MEVKVPSVKLNDCIKAAGVFMNILESMEPDDQKKELFMSAGLNSKNEIIYAEIVSMGSLTSAVVHAREVFRKAIVKTSCRIITCHNHPSGITEPSEDDIKLVRHLKRGGEILNIEMVDHLIIGRDSSDGYLSFEKKGLFIS